MKPIGPLMMEHRLFERMLAVLEGQFEAMQRGDPDPLLMAEVLDFFGTYADLNHHGKEDILFKALAAKPLIPEHRGMMEGLIANHVRARDLVGRVRALLHLFVGGDTTALAAMEPAITEILSLYPVHIEKEDKEYSSRSSDIYPRKSRRRCSMTSKNSRVRCFTDGTP